MIGMKNITIVHMVDAGLIVGNHNVKMTLKDTEDVRGKKTMMVVVGVRKQVVGIIIHSQTVKNNLVSGRTMDGVMIKGVGIIILKVNVMNTQMI